QPEVDARVIAKPERLEGGDGGAPHRIVNVVGKFRHQDLTAAIGARAFGPFHLGTGDVGRALRKVREIELDGRQGFGLEVAEDAYIDVAAVDVLLDEDWVVELGMELIDTLHELLDISGERVEADADRAVLAGGLDDDRELDVLGRVQPSSPDDRPAG